MADITITLTDTQMKALESTMLSPQEWIENLITAVTTSSRRRQSSCLGI